MKIKILIISFFITLISSAQQIGDGLSSQITDFSVPLRSGAYQSQLPNGMNPDATYDGWQHLFVIRHSNLSNNHQLQLSSTYTQNDRLFFRKIAITPTSTNTNPSWVELATRGTNNFTGDQNINGKLGLGTTASQASLEIKRNFDANSSQALKIFYQGSWGTPQYASNFRFIDIESSEGGKIFTLNGYGMGIGFNPPSYLSPDKLYINGNVGIGTNSPSAKLDVNTNLPSQARYDSQKWSTNNDGYNFKLQTIWDSQGINYEFIQKFGGVNHTSLAFYQGSVGIGTSTPDSKLTVAGNIHAREVKVTMNAGAVPDYVFTNNYKLKSLEEVEDYIKQNCHLPEIPSAKEIEKNGLMLAEMNMTLLKKIEEMTLYIIEQNKRIEKLEKGINKL